MAKPEEHLKFILLALYLMLSNASVDGRLITSTKITESIQLIGTLKTIKTLDGILIDCVDIYKQPAFHHPLLQNHIIQMKPSSYPREIKLETSVSQKNHLEDSYSCNIFQTFLNNEECPDGTIPIARTTKIYLPGVLLNAATDNPGQHEYAQISLVDGKYLGAQAEINVWNPATYDQEFSLAQIRVFLGQPDGSNYIAAGWMAQPGKNGPGFFISHTRDGKGCFDLQCSGFVHINNKVFLGKNVLQPSSTYNGRQDQISVAIFKDKQSGHWWVQLQGVPFGYWPNSVFSGLGESATAITWGGEILNSAAQGRHSSTQMGSGHFPNEGFGKAAFFRNVKYMDGNLVLIDAENVELQATKSACYDVHIENKSKDFGTQFYFGGPGYSDQCQ
ncbi:hypothetical protein SLE2022_384320 [Rubroshorea leprosula]